MRDNRIDLPCSYYDFTGGIDVFKGCKKLVPNNIPPVDQMFQSTRPRGARQVERDHYRVSVNNLQKELSALRKQLDVYGNPKYRISVFELNRELTDLRGRVERAIQILKSINKIQGHFDDNDELQLSIGRGTKIDNVIEILSGDKKE